MGLDYAILMPDAAVIADAFEAQAGAAVKNLESALTRSAIEIQGIARTQAPTRTGRLVNSINYSVLGLTAVIAPTVPYGVYVEMGTGLYGPKGQLIEPKNAQVLATKMNPGFGSANAAGFFIIGRYSRGQEANPFMGRTADLSLAVVEKNFGVTALGIVESLSK